MPPFSFGFAPVARTSEADLGQPLVDNDDPNYRSLGTAARDLLHTTHRQAQDLSVALYRGNPIANRTISIYTSFLAGRGAGLAFHNPEVEAVLTEFWESPRNQMPINHRSFARDYLLFGEAFHPVAADDAGNTTVGFIDPTTVPTVYRSPTNNLIIDAIDVRNPTGYGTTRLEAVTADADMTSDTAGLLVGDTFVWLRDRIAAATRGTPFLLPTLDWIDAYDQALWEMLERLKALRAYFWDVTVEGGDQQVREAKAQMGNSPPKSGSIRFHTDKVKIAAESPQLGGYEDVATARFQLRHIATGVGLAPHWLSEPEDANRSTAEQMDIPIYRGIADTQDEWTYRMTQLLRYVLDRKIETGRLAPVLPRHDESGAETRDLAPVHDLYEFQVPSIEPDRLERAAAVMAQTAQALLTFQAAGAAGTNLIRRVLRHLLPELGIPVDEIPVDDDVDVLADALEAVWRPYAGTRAAAGLAVHDTVDEAMRDIVAPAAAAT